MAFLFYAFNIAYIEAGFKNQTYVQKEAIADREMSGCQEKILDTVSSL